VYVGRKGSKRNTPFPVSRFPESFRKSFSPSDVHLAGRKKKKQNPLRISMHIALTVIVATEYTGLGVQRPRNRIRTSARTASAREDTHTPEEMQSGSWIV
jgi:hypothetical protein